MLEIADQRPRRASLRERRRFSHNAVARDARERLSRSRSRGCTAWATNSMLAKGVQPQHAIASRCEPHRHQSKPGSGSEP
jgi:hypothetical protein